MMTDSSVAANEKPTPAPKPQGTLIDSKPAGLRANLTEILEYRDLLFLLVRRDFVAQYKQTVLGPTWHLLQPLITTVIFTIVFSRIAKIPTDGLPPFLFYMCGTVVWTYFANSMNIIAITFNSNANIFAKVYFPRLIVPLSTLASRLIAFSIQFTLFIGFLLFYWITKKNISLSIEIVYAPVLLLMLAALAFGVGTLVAAMTVKYRDLQILIGFVTQLWMFASPIIYPLSSLSPKWQFWASLNPVAPIIEAFRYIFLGEGILNFTMLGVSALSISVLLCCGIFLFNKTSRTVVDTI